MAGCTINSSTSFSAASCTYNSWITHLNRVRAEKVVDGEFLAKRKAVGTRRKCLTVKAAERSRKGVDCRDIAFIDGSCSTRISSTCWPSINQALVQVRNYNTLWHHRLHPLARLEVRSASELQSIGWSELLVRTVVCVAARRSCSSSPVVAVFAALGESWCRPRCRTAPPCTR